MSTFRRFLTLALTLALGLGALLAGAPLALAQPIPDLPGVPGTGHSTPAPAVSDGSPLWVFIVVAAASAATAIAATWLVSTRVRHPHQLSPTPA
jgi:hypothetical protein